MNGQEAAILKTRGPCVILAGAGTGKTYTIVEKIKYLVKNNIYRPERIVCITFSNEAANNLLSRVQKALSLGEGKQPIIKTFHAFSAELLRKYGREIGINKDFNILTPDDAKVVLHRYLKVPAGNCHKYISSIGTAKDLGIGIESLRSYLERKTSEFGKIDLGKRLEELQFSIKTLYLSREKKDKKEISLEIKKISSLINLKKFVGAWSAYEKIKAIKNYQDYSDLNKNALHLLEKNKNISSDYDYIIIDEFQDTNKVQLDLLEHLALHKNISVVGDLNQSIYRFRGAYRKNFKEFRERFGVSDSDIFSLDKSYRSSNKILKAAHKLILNNYSKEKECFIVLNHEKREGENIKVYELKNAKEEARRVVELIREEISKGVEIREICVMFRTHQQGRIIRRALEFEKVPFVSVSKNSLLKEKSIKTAIDYLTIVNKLKNGEKGGEREWWDLIYQLGFSEEDLIKIGRFIKDNKESQSQQAAGYSLSLKLGNNCRSKLRGITTPSLSNKEVENLSKLMVDSLTEINLSDSGKMNAKILAEKIKILLKESDKEAPELVKYVYNIAGLLNRQETKEDKAVMLNLNRFYELAKEHAAMHSPDLGSFIYYLGILESLGIEIQAVELETEGVRLMTLHATKGLEYKSVIITNLCQKRFPIESFNSNSLIPLELSPEFEFNLSDRDIDYIVHEREREAQLFEERRLCYVAFTRAKDRLILTYADEYGGRRFYPSQFLQEVQYKENPDLSFFLDLEEKYKEEIQAIKGADTITIKNSTKELAFSPSALLSFVECEKKYEYRYVYNMPEQKTISWEAIMLGSFVHRVLEAGVKLGFKSLKEFEDLAREMQLETDWEGIELAGALHLVKVFFERNKNKYNASSKTEQLLKMKIGEISFIGFADRIDFNDDGIEIIDYKTGNANVSTRAREWQLGYYALAALQFGKIKKVTLDMLNHEKPLEFEIDSRGEAMAVNSDRIKGFNIYNVEQELVRAAHHIIDAYKNGFKPCAIERNCDFCNEWVWKL